MDAEELKKSLQKHNERGGPVFKLRNDPRVTRVGSFLRRSSLDELPQLFNILRGDMSIVGPRPALPQEVEKYSARALQRLTVPPGLTGLWQVSGRAKLSFDDMVDLDLRYIEERSLWTNFKIILKTIPAVLFADGAY
jgi:lipopolysaccharide/colanic/teichoic acid biosynthesis glycosyltransferase